MSIDQNVGPGLVVREGSFWFKGQSASVRCLSSGFSLALVGLLFPLGEVTSPSSDLSSSICPSLSPGDCWFRTMTGFLGTTPTALQEDVVEAGTWLCLQTLRMT